VNERTDDLDGHLAYVVEGVVSEDPDRCGEKVGLVRRADIVLAPIASDGVQRVYANSRIHVA
jgi:hypothetical protein